MKRDKEVSAYSLNAEDDENYFVSLSDLMTGVLFVFVILTLFFCDCYLFGSPLGLFTTEISTEIMEAIVTQES